MGHSSFWATLQFLVDSRTKVDNLVEMRTEFDCLVKILKKGPGEPMSETTSKESSCNKP